MSTDIRPEVSSRSRWYIPRERYYELKHFCRQYRSWVLESVDICGKYPSEEVGRDELTEEQYERRELLKSKISLVESIAKESEPSIANYILLAVCDGVPYTNLRYKLGMPCGKDYFYDRYRKFFWLLNIRRK